MPTSDSTRFIGFPPPLLGERPARLPVLGAEPGRWLALDKPAEVLTDRHRWHPELPGVLPALTEQAAAGKPELEPYGIVQARHIYVLEPEITGVLLFALDEEPLQELREAYGSGQMTFTFGMLARYNGGKDERTCRLPLAIHNTEPRALVTHTSGKKCETRFRLVERLGDYAWWEAQAVYMRPHQIRLHAAEVGLPIVGDPLYGGPPPICLSALKPGYRNRGEERPLYAGLCLHLGCLDVQLPEEKGFTVSAELPKGLSVLQRKLTQYR
ncbi:MAG: RNA pseudouridine synthase [Verrucomicrobiota bacterium JB024]|nr:RNA pseudouridine synthase [Verrucomicrobiota bacterium JB024]